MKRKYDLIDAAEIYESRGVYRKLAGEDISTVLLSLTELPSDPINNKELAFSFIKIQRYNQISFNNSVNRCDNIEEGNLTQWTYASCHKPLAKEANNNSYSLAKIAESLKPYRVENSKSSIQSAIAPKSETKAWVASSGWVYQSFLSTQTIQSGNNNYSAEAKKQSGIKILSKMFKSLARNMSQSTEIITWCFSSRT